MQKQNTLTQTAELTTTQPEQAITDMWLLPEHDLPYSFDSPNEAAIYSTDSMRSYLEVHGSEDSKFVKSLESKLARKAIALFISDGYVGHPYSLFKTLEYFADKPEFGERFIHELLSRNAPLQELVIDEFGGGSTDPTIVGIATGRAFVRYVWGATLETRMKSLDDGTDNEELAAVERVFKLEQAILERSGFTEDERRDIVDAWSAQWFAKGAHARKKRIDEASEALRYEGKSLVAVSSLYRMDPDAAKRLYTEFGIRNFGRYYDINSDETALVTQLSPDYVPSGNVVLTAVDDWNGAMDGHSPKNSANTLGMDQPTFIEARSPLEALRRLIRISKQSKLRVKRLLVLAHGGKHNIDDLTIDDLRNFSGIEKLKGKVFSEYADIILDSCDTGKRRGIAGKLFKLTGIKVTAPSAGSSGALKTKDGRTVFGRKRGRPSSRTYASRYKPRHSGRAR